MKQSSFRGFRSSCDQFGSISFPEWACLAVAPEFHIHPWLFLRASAGDLSFDSSQEGGFSAEVQGRREINNKTGRLFVFRVVFELQQSFQPFSFRSSFLLLEPQK